MGVLINPAALSQSGERCLSRISELQRLDLPTPQVFAPIATAVEVHMSNMIGRLIVLSDIDKTPLGAALLQEVESDLTRTWNDRHRWLNRGFGLPLAGQAPGQQFDTLVEVRNSVVHGDGQLSEDQQKLKLSKLVTLKKNMRDHLQVTADGRLRFGQSTSKMAFEVARKFVAYADSQILATYPKARIL